MKQVIIALVLVVAAIALLFFVLPRPNPNPNLVFIQLAELPGISKEVVQANGQLFRVQEPFLYDRKTKTATFIISIVSRKHFGRSDTLVFGGDNESLRLFVNEVKYVNSLPNSAWEEIKREHQQFENGQLDAVVSLANSVTELVKNPIKAIKVIGRAVDGLARYSADAIYGNVNVVEDATQLCSAYRLNMRCSVGWEHGLNYLDLKTTEAKEAIDVEAHPRIEGRIAAEFLMLIVPFAAAKYASKATEVGAIAERMAVAGRIDADAAKGLRWSDAFSESATAMRRLERLPQTTERAHLVSLPRAKVGLAKTTDYRKTFLEAFPSLEKEISEVHHAIPQRVMRDRPDLYSELQIHSLENLRGIPGGTEYRALHPTITKEWNKFYRENPASSWTREKIENEATRIDNIYGHEFKPRRF